MPRAPVDWILGDPSRERIYRVLTLFDFGIALAFGAFSFLAFYALLGGAKQLADSGIWSFTTLDGVLFPLLVVALSVWDLAYVQQLPNRSPGSVPVGVSARGLVVRYTLGTRTYSWKDIRWWDASHLEVREWLGTNRLTLSPSQSQAIHDFFHRPLPTERVQGDTRDH